MRSLKAMTAILVGCFLLPLSDSILKGEGTQQRKPNSDEELRYWLENMVVWHGFSVEEVQSATGLSREEIDSALKKFSINTGAKPTLNSKGLVALPYPGGRHPRIGFLEGAINPQRETKISVFAPWDLKSYVVIDVPEAIWSHRGLLYLAHTHIPTIWDQQKAALKPLEWSRQSDGTLTMERTLPNGIRFGTKVRSFEANVSIDLWLTNGSTETWRDLRVQNCVMLKGAPGFNVQSNSNKVHQSPYVACRSDDNRRWIITAWEPCHRTWTNEPVPCIHSDPKFPDCASGETKQLRGWLSFYEGNDIYEEFRRIDRTGWRNSSTGK